MYAEMGGMGRHAGDSVIEYTNVCLDGEKQQGRLEVESYNTDMYAERVRNSKAGWRQCHKYINVY